MIAQGDIQGHWVRHWIKAPGFEDYDTRVHWMQAGTNFADIRIPLERPDLGSAAGLCELAPAALAALAKAEGFAGKTQLEANRCTWLREINWHGTPDAADIGAISFDAAGRMIEAGVEADYTELWEQAAKPADQGQAWRLSGAGYEGVLIVQNERFVLGIGRAEKPASKPLIEALNAGASPVGLPDFFDGLHAYGAWDGAVGTAELATQPFCEGKEVVQRHENALIWHRVGFDGSKREVHLQIEGPGA